MECHLLAWGGHGHLETPRNLVGEKFAENFPTGGIFANYSAAKARELFLPLESAVA